MGGHGYGDNSREKGLNKPCRSCDTDSCFFFVSSAINVLNR